MAVALIVAAGSGERLGAEPAEGARAARRAADDAVEHRRAAARPRIAGSWWRCRRVRRPRGGDGCPGGAVRSESVRLALAAAGPGETVLVHDAAAPAAESRPCRAGARRPQQRSHARRGDRGRPGQRHGQARRRRRAGCSRRSTRLSVGRPDAPGVPPRGARTGARPSPGGTRPGHRRRLAGGISEAGGGSVLARADPQGHRPRPTCAWRSWCWPARRPGPPILIESPRSVGDLHLHLRPDDPDASAEEYYSAANAERYRGVAGERGIDELGVSEHVYRFTQALEIWRHPLWERYAHDDLDAYCRAVRGHTDLRLGTRARLHPRPRAADRAGCWRAAASTTWSARCTSSATRRSTWTSSASGRGSARAPRGGLGALLPDGRRQRPQPPVRHHRPPRPGEVLGRPSPGPRGRPAPLLRARRGSLRRLGGGGGALHRRAAQARRGGSIPPRPSSSCASRPASRWRCRATPTAPADVGAGYEVALALLERLGVDELARFQGRVRTMAPVGAGQRTG